MNGAPGIVLGKGNLDRSMQARERDALDERVSIYMCVCRTYRLKATLTTYIYIYDVDGQGGMDGLIS